VIITGGGEPTLHSQWWKLIQLLGHWKYEGLKFGLITNGTSFGDVALDIFDWIRISLNYGTDRFIDMKNLMVRDDCTIGLSLIYSGKNKAYSLDHLLYLIQRHNAEYLRILPDCRPEDLKEAHKEIDKFISDPFYTHRIFHQEKHHRAPNAIACHQAYFRPYLSEIGGGTVFPCDSVVLNGSPGKFEDKYAICKALEIGDFLDGKIKLKFDPHQDCKGCVFTNNVEALQRWTMGIHDFTRNYGPIKHEDFI
jgi:hypothetical protein